MATRIINIKDIFYAIIFDGRDYTRKACLDRYPVIYQKYYNRENILSNNVCQYKHSIKVNICSKPKIKKH